MRYGILDDHGLLREAISRSIPGCIWQGAALADLTKRPKLDILVIDLVLPDGNALDWLDSQDATEPIVVISMAKADAMIHRLLKANVHGLVHKDDPLETLEQAMRAALDGHVFHSTTFRSLRAKIVRAPDSAHKILSDREQELLTHLSAGLNNAEIAQVLGIRAGTVADHKTAIMRKVGAKNQLELMRYAVERGFTH